MEWEPDVASPSRGCRRSNGRERIERTASTRGDFVCATGSRQKHGAQWGSTWLNKPKWTSSKPSFRTSLLRLQAGRYTYSVNGRAFSDGRSGRSKSPWWGGSTMSWAALSSERRFWTGHPSQGSSSGSRILRHVRTTQSREYPSGRGSPMGTRRHRIDRGGWTTCRVQQRCRACCARPRVMTAADIVAG